MRRGIFLGTASFLMLTLQAAGSPSEEEVMARDRATWASVPKSVAKFSEAPKEWTRVKAGVLGVTLAFPCKPEEKLLHGVHLILLYTCLVDGRAYMATLERFPSDIGTHANEVLAGVDYGSLESFAKRGVTATLTPKTHVTFEGAIGREVRIQSPTLTVDKRSLIKKELSLDLSVTAKPGDPKNDAQTFFNGLRFD